MSLPVACYGMHFPNCSSSAIPEKTDHLPGYTVLTVRASLKTRHAETEESAESEGVIDSQKHREILSRRPCYRKILNELSSDVPGVPKIEEEKSEEEGTPPNSATMAVPTSIYQTSTEQYSMYAAIHYVTVLALSLL
ncbi:cAMP-responsive element modulator-like [Mustela putorius furo]|uniref:cAMP-responsive element modulator n=1 Tax=Mustela putorius furo TaxID=9669 RepID=A0A8U0RGG9_MUSPF|nr:cAMP-responsive element modulator-like [Mustela putorius furo]